MDKERKMKMKILLTSFVILLALFADAQILLRPGASLPSPRGVGLSSRRGMLRRPGVGVLNRRDLSSRSPTVKFTDSPLVKLMPFPEAVQKAKDGDAAGYYAVALHYAQGYEIPKGMRKAHKYFCKAVEKKDPNAIFLDVIHMEQSLEIPCPRLDQGPGDMTGWPEFGTDYVEPNYLQYTGNIPILDSYRPSRPVLCITNASDVAKIGAAYQMAFSLGVKYATNELARFEKRVAAVNAGIEKRLAAVKAHKENLKRNEKLAEELLGEKPNGGGGAFANLRARREAQERARREEKARQATAAEQAKAEHEKVAKERAAQREALQRTEEELRRQRESLKGQPPQGQAPSVQ